MPMPILRCRYCKFYITHFTKTKMFSASITMSMLVVHLIRNKNVQCFKVAFTTFSSQFHTFFITISSGIFFFQIIFSLDSPIQCDGAVSFLITLHGSASEENSSKVTELFRGVLVYFCSSCTIKKPLPSERTHQNK